MTLDHAYRFICDHLPYSDPGSFYGASAGLSLGAGLLYSNVRQPAFNSDTRLYRTIKTDAYVLTHECDADQQNDRVFKDAVLVCPVIPLPNFLEGCTGHSNIHGFLAEIAARQVHRLLYLPPIEPLKYGGMLYLNRITSVHVSTFSEPGTQCIGAVAAKGLFEVDSALQNLLLREKAQRLTGMRVS